MDIINVSSPNDGLGDKLRDAMVKVNANFGELLNTINNLDFSISAIDGLNDALNMISASISGLQTQINTLDSRVDNHDEDISNINSDIVTVNSSISTINDTIAQILNDIANQEVEFEDYQTTTNTILNGLQNDLSGAYTAIQDIQDEQEVQNLNISDLQDMVSGLTGSGIVPTLRQVTLSGSTFSGSITGYSVSGQQTAALGGSGLTLNDNATGKQIQLTTNYFYIEDFPKALTIKADRFETSTATFSFAETGGILATEEFVLANAGSGGATPSGLVQITEGGKTGWRLAESNPANYGNIGQGAVDVSISLSSSSSRGATGTHSFAAGFHNEVSGEFATVGGGSGNYATSQYSTIAGGSGTYLETSNYVSVGGGGSHYLENAEYSAISGGNSHQVKAGYSFVGGGNYNQINARYSSILGGNSNSTYATYSSILGGTDNTTYGYAEVVAGLWSSPDNTQNRSSWVATDRIFTVGNGYDNWNKSNALIILKNGLATLPSVTNAIIASASGKAIVTKEYLASAFNIGSLASFNFAIGDEALSEITSGTYNMGLGSSAGASVTTGMQNMFVGAVSGAYTTTGSRNTGIGCASLFTNISGGFNTAIGNFALYRSLGFRNTAIGVFAGSAITTGENNVVIGSDSAADASGLSIGSFNTLIGNTVTGITGGSYSTIIGRVTGLSGTASNLVIVADGQGNQAIRKESNGTTVVPSQANALIAADATGKAIITKEFLTAGFTASIVVGADTVTNAITGNQIRIRHSSGAPITTMNLNGYSVSSSSGLATYGATKITSGGYDFNLPTAESGGTIATIGTTAPASATDTGTVGEIRVTSTYIYTCTAPNTWRRAALSTW